MLTIDQIRQQIHPVPQKITAMEGTALKLIPSSKIALTAPEAEKGPVKTAVGNMKAYLTSKLGKDCFAADGIAITLKLAEKPAEVKSETEGYRITVNAEGITIEGFGASGLFYGVVTFKQLCQWNSDGAEILAMELLDWPDNPFRAFKQECRYGSNMMEKADWFEMIDDLASKKLNHLSLAIYGCWQVQYDGRVAEYLYLPLKNYPHLKTPQTVKYYSPSEGKWLNYEALPPIFRDNFLGDVIRYAKDRGIDVIPGINSLGHNTLFPRLLPEVAPINDDGVSQPTGFCTSSEETYKLLFSTYDQIIDEYLIPNEIYTFNILLDEVWEQFGVDPDDLYTQKTPWCRCEKCKNKERSEIFIEHAIKLLKHLKEKGMKSIVMANDMVARKVSKLGDISAPFLKRIEEEGLRDVLFFDWWWYHDLKAKLDFVVEPDTLGFRSFFCAWNGYYIWDILQSPLKNSQILAEMNHNAHCGEGIYLYAMWDRSYDRVHDCFADYAWNYIGTGDTDDVTERYAARHFAPMQEEAIHAYKLLDWISEERKEVIDKEQRLCTILSPLTTLRKLSYYLYCYFNKDQAYPREFPGNALNWILPNRMDVERFLFTVAAMAKEAKAIFDKASVTPGCDQAMARRMAYECHNYIVLMEDWESFLKIYDLTQGGDQKKIAPIARKRQQERLALMEHCEHTKEDWVCKAATMRNLSVFMQIFADIAAYIESTDAPALDLLNIKPICSKENLMLR